MLVRGYRVTGGSGGYTLAVQDAEARACLARRRLQLPAITAVGTEASFHPIQSVPCCPPAEEEMFCVPCLLCRPLFVLCRPLFVLCL